MKQDYINPEVQVFSVNIKKLMCMSFAVQPIDDMDGNLS